MNTDSRIRALRPPRPEVDAWRPLDVLAEEELLPSGKLAPSLTVFLAGSECPFTCVFCDLWRFTLEGPTPPGAIPAQLELALAQVSDPASTHLKLYNASNFFDDRAVPPEDDPRILQLLAPFPQVVVECHPRLVGKRCRAFAEALPGRLQVAMGLETVHPDAAAKLNKRSLPPIFARASADLRDWGCGLRAFLLVGAPFVPPEEDSRWVQRSARFAFEQGAEHVALIPLRGGNGEMERLAREGHFSAPSLHRLETAFDACLAIAPRGAVVSVDLWDLETLARCDDCATERIARLGRINHTGLDEARILCAACSPTEPQTRSAHAPFSDGKVG